MIWLTARMELMVREVSEGIIGGAFTVANTLGTGFLEKVYENSLAVELRSRGLAVLQQAPIKVSYRGTIVGAYFADLRVENLVIVELKAVGHLEAVHEAQCLNYLRASNLPLCLLFNFARPRLEFRRLVLSPNR